MRTNFISVMLLAAALFTSCHSKQTQETESNEQAAPIVEAQIPVVNWAKLDRLEYLQYHNRRFGFYVDFPFFMQMEYPPQNGDGFSCQCQGLSITGWGTLNSDIETMQRMTIQEVADEYEPNPDSVLLKKENMMVVKGKKKGKVYYWKFVNREHITYCLHIEYDFKHSDVLDPIAIHIMESFDCLHPGEEG